MEKKSDIGHDNKYKRNGEGDRRSVWRFTEGEDGVQSISGGRMWMWRRRMKKWHIGRGQRGGNSRVGLHKQ